MPLLFVRGQAEKLAYSKKILGISEYNAMSHIVASVLDLVQILTHAGYVKN